MPDERTSIQSPDPTSHIDVAIQLIPCVHVDFLTDVSS